MKVSKYEGEKNIYFIKEFLEHFAQYLLGDLLSQIEK